MAGRAGGAFWVARVSARTPEQKIRGLIDRFAKRFEIRVFLLSSISSLASLLRLLQRAPAICITRKRWARQRYGSEWALLFAGPSALRRHGRFLMRLHLRISFGCHGPKAKTAACGPDGLGFEPWLCCSSVHGTREAQGLRLGNSSDPSGRTCDLVTSSEGLGRCTRRLACQLHIWNYLTLLTFLDWRPI
jgi:hypothetical protein